MSILCVDISKIKSDFKIQKTVDLQNLINTCLKGFDDLEQAEREGYIPLNFAISIRTVYTNLVVESESIYPNKKAYYENVSNLNSYFLTMHKGYDFIMFVASMGFLDFIVYNSLVNEFMMKYSDFSIVGLYYDGISKPTIVCHVIIKDEGIKSLLSHLKAGNKLVHISEIDPKDSNAGILSSFIIIKEENKK